MGHIDTHNIGKATTPEVSNSDDSSGVEQDLPTESDDRVASSCTAITTQSSRPDDTYVP